MRVINSFRKEYFFLSNFYERPLVFDGITYPTSEHAFQAQKTLDLSVRAWVASLEKPSDAKFEGGRLKLRTDWEGVKDRVMFDVVFQKFKQNPDLLKRLLDTKGVHLEEGNTWGDDYWGTINGGQGQNKLGVILMLVRDGYEWRDE